LHSFAASLISFYQDIKQDIGISKLHESAIANHHSGVAKNPGIMLRLPIHVIEALDRWRARLPGVPNRQKAIQIALADRLKAEGRDEPPKEPAPKRKRR
jgi:hypothetical protein